MILRLPIKPEPHRVDDPDCENYGQILWPKLKYEDGSSYWNSEPNPCPVGEVGDQVGSETLSGLSNLQTTYVIKKIDVEGGPQIAPSPHLPWVRLVLLEEV